MPKPGTVNTLLNPPQQGFNPQKAGMVAIPQLGQGLVNSINTSRPPAQTAAFNPQSSTALPSPQMTNNIQSGGATSLGTPIPAQPKSLPSANSGAPQYPAVSVGQQAATSPLGVSPTGNTTALPGQNQGTQNAPQQSTPMPTYTGIVGSLANFNSPVGQQANTQAQEAYKNTQGLIGQLKQSRDAEATAIANQGQAPIPMGDITGRQAVIRQLYETQQANLGSQAQAESALYGPALTAAGLGQGQNLQGLQSAATAAKPELGAFGQGYYNPIDPAQANSSPYGTGPAAAANVASIQSLTQQANDWSASRQAATNIGSQLTNFLSSNQVNPADFNAVNRFLQTIGAQTSSPQYKQFYNLITDLANTYAPVLSTTGDATNYKTELAQSLLDGTASGQTIPQILQSLDAQAQAKIQGVIQTRDRLQSGGNVNPEAPYGSTGSASTLSWDNI